MSGAGAVVLVGGYGVVGTQLAHRLRSSHPDVRIIIAGRSLERAQALARELGAAEGHALDVKDDDPLASLAEPPGAVVAIVNDPADRLLLACVRRRIPYVDITRWTSRVCSAVLRLAGEPLGAPVMLASSWMGGVVPLAAAAATRGMKRVDEIETSVLYALEDRAGADAADYVDRLTVPFEVHEGGRARVVEPWTDQRNAFFPGVGYVPVYRLDTPEQATLPLVLGAQTVSTRLGFDAPLVSRALATMKRTGLLTLLSHDIFGLLRRRLLHSDGKGGEARLAVEVRGGGEGKRVEVRDPEGQAHLTAIGGLINLRRALGWDGAPAQTPGIWFPEHSTALDDALATLRAAGVSVSIDSIAPAHR